MHLYHHPRTRGTRVLWTLEEIGAPYGLTLMDWADRTSPEHLARHPLGRIPAAEDAAGPLFESAAICLHAADLHPEARLIGPVGTHERALHYQWVLFAVTELEPPSGAYRQAVTAGDEPAVAAALDRLRPALAAVEAALGDGEVLVGGRFSVADVLVGSVLAMSGPPEAAGDLPAVRAYLARLDARPARQRALAIGA